jgi:predicted O-methyltransferase YrrM
VTLLGPAPREYPVPSGIPTSVTLHELALLQRFAAEAGTVLEIGTHYGFSCIGMALAGAHVTSVDPHFEGPANDPDTWEPFLANLRRHHVWDDVEPIRDISANIEQYAQAGQSRSWGMVFIDGDHVWPQPWFDAVLAKRVTAAIVPDADRFIAFHDVTRNWPGVYRAALQLEESGWPEVGRVQTLRVYRAPTRSGLRR